MTQKDRILRHMADFGSITQIEAMRDYGIMRLASRINDLRRDGVGIDVVMERTKNRYGEPCTYARYSLAGKEQGHAR